MLDAIKRLVESGIINDDTKDAITEAWDTQLNEAKQTIRAELREEFAGRYEHDKSVMVTAIDKMVTESLTQELKEFAEDKKALASERVKFKRHVKESSAKINRFLVSKLAEEIQEFRKDRKIQTEATGQLEKFVIGALSEEISEFAQDKKAVVETKVRLVAEAKKQLGMMRHKFIERSAKLVKESVQSSLNTEMTQLKEDITSARENMFGRRIFEAFAGEFAITHLNENKEIAGLRKQLGKAQTAIVENRKKANKKAKLVESKNKEIKIIKESASRQVKLDNLLGSLNEEKATVMGELLESVQTVKLQAAFDKYLPAVLNGRTPARPQRKAKAQLNESRKSVTGNKKTAKAPVKDREDNTNIIEIQRLAGLK